MEKINISTEFIKLDQFLKLTGISSTGAEAKILISQGQVMVNGIKELQRGKKLRRGDMIEINRKSYQIE